MFWTIKGNPIGKQRHRARGFIKNGKVTARTYSKRGTSKTGTKTSHLWESEAATIFAASEIVYSGAVYVVVDAVKSRPKAMSRKKDPLGRIVRTRKPDGDNVLKCVQDAAQKAGIVNDDAQFTEALVRSWYTAKEEDPCVEVSIGLWPRPALADIVWCPKCGGSVPHARWRHTSKENGVLTLCPICKAEEYPLTASMLPTMIRSFWPRRLWPT